MIDKVFIFILALTFVNCNKVSNKNDVQSNLDRVQEVSYVFDLKDTLLVDKTYKGIIYFKSDLDTITNSFDDTINFRIVTFHLFEPRKLLGNSLVTLKDSLRIMKKEIVLENLRFKEKGKYIISGLITDVVLMNYFDAQGKRDSFRYINKEQYIEKEVLVIE